MNVRFKKEFLKQYEKLGAYQKKINERLALFSDDSYNRLLNNHALTGNYQGYRSINITGDIRAIYKLINPDLALFVAIGSHSNLYR